MVGIVILKTLVVVCEWKIIIKQVGARQERE